MVNSGISMVSLASYTVLIINSIQYSAALPALNPDFAVEIVMRVSNAIQIRVSGYFLDERIVYYFESKKCSERLIPIGFCS